jgi:CBS domain-containing protein
MEYALQLVEATPIAASYDERCGMRAGDTMTRRVVTVAPGAPIEKAVRLMLRHRVSGLPVVDGSGKLVGIITEGDLLRRAETGTEHRRPRWLTLLLGCGRSARDYIRSHARKVEDVMTRDVVSITETTPISEVVELMEIHRIKRLPVLRRRRLVGIVSRANLIRALVAVAGKAPVARVRDTEIRNRILAEIDGQPWSPGTSVDAVVRNRVVDLWGAITSETQRQALRTAAETVAGVRMVRDHLTKVDPLSGMAIALRSRQSTPRRASKKTSGRGRPSSH